jgi:two-component sensor histidine kinase
LNAELDHRVKNVLATVSAIIDQTRSANSRYSDFVVGLDRRIRSLANTHDLLSRAQWHGVALTEIVQREFAPYGRGNSELRGPSVTLKAEAAQAVAMVLHELTTNAAKHGAFSKRNGGVLLNWWWRQDEGRPRLVIDWKEIGGPPVEEPTRSGYGTSVVRELIPFELGGTVELDYPEDGLRCRLEIPADWVSTGLLNDTYAEAGRSQQMTFRNGDIEL